MSKKLFLDMEIIKLSKNKNIYKVSNKAMTYTFKFIDEYKIEKLPRIIFEELGLDIDILGMKRIEAASKSWRKFNDRIFNIVLKNLWCFC